MPDVDSLLPAYVQSLVSAAILPSRERNINASLRPHLPWRMWKKQKKQASVALSVLSL
jgi:hypothetical protein